jgi:ATP-binding cassette subfamily C exporter for protease/lipase
MSAEQRRTALREAVSRLRPELRQAFLYSIVISLLALAPIGYMRDVYGPVLDARSGRSLAFVTALLVLALAMSGFLEWVRARVMQAAAVKFAQEISPRVFEATFRANLHRLQGAGQALSDLRVIRTFITSPTLTVIMDVPLGAIFLGLVFLINPLMGLLSLLGASTIALLGWWTERRIKPQVEEAQQFNGASQVVASSGSRNAQVVEAMGMTTALQRRWMAARQQYLAKQANVAELQAVAASANKLIMLSQGSLLLGIGMMLTLLEILPPSVGAFLIIAKLLGNRAVGPLMQLINSWKQVVTARDAFDRLEAFLERVQPLEQRMRMPAPKGLLQVEGASVRAPGTKKTVVLDAAFTVKPGQVLAVIGNSGSGKSSLARALVGVWPPMVGTLRLDGVDIGSWDKTELGPFLGYLPQDVELFDGTIAENIARFGEVDPLKLQAAIEYAGLHDLIRGLPNGVATLIGDDGAVLSGGQRQRVALARALYGDPSLIVLDEPNSSLDQRGDRDLLKGIQAMKEKGSAIVVVTHREALYPVVDLILVMEDGRPKLYGARDKVLAQLKPAAAQATTKQVAA